MLPVLIFFFALLTSWFAIQVVVGMSTSKLIRMQTKTGAKDFSLMLDIAACLLWAWFYWLSH